LRTSKAKYSPGSTLVAPGSGSGVTSLRKGFTLVELIIVVSILGILAAIVLPEFQGHISQAKESQAKANLRIFREVLARYRAEHTTPAGYFNGNTSSNALDTFLIIQLTQYTSVNSEVSLTRSTKFCNGPYLDKIPPNPFNGQTIISVLANGVTTFPATPPANTGWVYMPSLNQIRLACSDTDSEGKSIYAY